MSITYICLVFVVLFFIMGDARSVIKDRKRDNRIRIKSEIFTKSDFGDFFAKLFDIRYDDKDKDYLTSVYSFLDKFEYKDRLYIGWSLKNFWKRYKEEEEKLKQDPNYELYRIFVLNVGNGLGSLVEKPDCFEFSVDKFVLMKEYNPLGVFPNTYGCFMGGGSGGTNSGTGATTIGVLGDIKLVGCLKVKALEKMVDLWEDVRNCDERAKFIISKDKVSDFVSLCYLVCGEEIIW